MTTLEFHPLANLFPLIEGEEFDALVADIRDNGMTEKIVLLDGQILDGRNRYRAVLAGGLFEDTEDPRSGFYFANLAEGVDPLTFVLSKNLHRRHLTDDQRRMVAAKIVTMGRGRPGENAAIGGIKRAAAAAMLSVDDAGTERARAVVTKGIDELRQAVDSGQATVRAAAEIARLSPEQQRAVIAEVAKSPDTKKAFRDVAREVRGGEVNGARSIMGSRQEPDDSLDYFPTPPWATRALCHHVMPAAGFAGKRFRRVWEPACGEGHMAEVLAEYADELIASDVHDYGYGRAEIDFLVASDMLEDGADWIISNPPFGDLTEAFVLKALAAARVGVAMFVRLQWLESVGRYEAIFRDHPPTVIAFFAERVNLCKGRWEPDGSTATAYIWLVWAKGEKPRPPFWIPPGRREALTRPDDRERFTAHPVVAIDHTHHDPDTGEIIEQPPQHGADISVRNGEGSPAPVEEGTAESLPLKHGLEVRTKPEAGARIAPASDLDLDIPDSLRRVAMTEDERAFVEGVDLSRIDSENARLKVAALRRHPASMTALDRNYLARIAERVAA